MEALIGLLILAVVLVPILLIVALAQIAGLRARLSRLEQRVAEQAEALSEARFDPRGDETLAERIAREAPPSQQQPVRPPRPVVPGTAAPPTAPPSATASPVVTTPGTVPPVSAPTPPPANLPPPIPQDAAAARPAAARAAPAAWRAPAAPPPPDVFTVAARWLRRWFTEGNVPVKVGMLVLFAGVAALLKYATDQGWLHLPIELRLAGVALAAMAGLVFGWRQRERKRSFALSLQGGAIGVLLLVVFAAFKLYQLMPAGAAFAISVVLVAGAGVLAVKQNAMALAVFAILAGFLAPIWLSTGSGNHVALFGYYAVLNAGIFAIAWWRPWRVLNLLGFVFTWGIGTLWGVLKYRPEHFSTTEPFLLLFFAFYLLIPVLYARKRPAGHRDLIDGCLVFGTPLVAFTLQAGLLEGERMPLAFCALSLGALYAALAWWLRRDSRFLELSTPYALLAVGFATLAIPLALAAEATACVFALEGAAMVWLGLRQQRRLPQLVGFLLQGAAAFAFVIGASDAVWDAQVPLLNASFAGALLIAVAGFASAWSHRRSDSPGPALPYYLWGLAWWLGAAGSEIADFVPDRHSADAVLMLTAASGWIAAEVFRRHAWKALSLTAMFALLSALPLLFVQTDLHDYPLAGFGWIAWALYAVFGWRNLTGLRERAGGELGLGHSGWCWAWALVIGVSLLRVATLWQHASVPVLGTGWSVAALLLPILAMAATLLWRPGLVAQPLSQRFAGWRAPLLASFAIALALAIGFTLATPANPRPLMWLPLLNPLGLMQWAVLTVLGAWLASPLVGEELRRRRVPLLAAAGFVLITVEVLRSAHYWGGVEWSSSMFSTSLVQTSLTVVWSVLGVAGWIAGSRRGQRGLWLAGALLMAVVLAKLVLVDRGHLGNLLGIASFIAYGLLCTLVGYFAPAPPGAPPPPRDDGRPDRDLRDTHEAQA